MGAVPRVILVFVDGLGLGPPDPRVNPLRHPGLGLLGLWRAAGWRPPPGGGTPPTLPAVEHERPLTGDAFVEAADASLGLPGLPQSATGQTTLLTGTNAARAIGGHVFGFPTGELRAIIARESILRRVVDSGRRATFLNAYRPRFFELGEAVWSRRLSVTTWANRAAGLRFRDIDDLRAGRAVYQDITHDSEPAEAFDLPRRSPEEAGEILAAIAAEHHLTLFEFFQSDRAGHARDRAWAERELVKLDRMLCRTLSMIDRTTTTVVLCSDHGNIEDLSTRTHTLNPVPMMVIGREAARVAPTLDRLEAVTPAVLALLGDPSGQRRAATAGDGTRSR